MLKTFPKFEASMQKNYKGLALLIALLLFSPTFITAQCDNCTPPDLTLSGVVFASNQDLSGSHTCLAINGTYIVDINVTILGAVIHMGENAKIVIKPGARLELNSVSFQGCGVMWEGIVLQPGGELYSSDVAYMDALNAITVDRGSTLTVKFCVFDRNRIGIHFRPMASFPGVSKKGVALLEPITNNIFKSEGTLLPPHAGETSFSGISVDLNAAIHIGAAGWPGNEFKWMRNGITVKKGTVTITNANIYEIIGGSNLGIGVSENADVKVFDSTFENCSNGIQSQQSHLTVKGCNFSTVIDTSPWIFVTDSPFKRIVINENSFTGSQWRGIQCDDVGTASKLEIKDNHDIEMLGILGDGNSFYAIGMGESVLIDHSNTLIENNIVTGNNLYGGIALSNISKAQVIDNKVETDRNLPPFIFFDILGDISLDECSEIDVIDNDLTLTNDTPYARSRGLSITNSGQTDAQCNTTDGSENGIAFIGSNGSTYLSNNTMNEHTYGLFLDGPNSSSPLIGANTFIGEQGAELQAHDNQWDGPYTFNSIGASNGGDANVVEMSRFHVRNSTTPQFPPNPESIVTWFVTDGIGDPMLCGTLEEESENLDESAIKIAKGIIDFGDFHDGLSWRAEMQLYRKLESSPSLIGLNSHIDSFHLAASSSNIGAYYDIERSINDLYVPSTPIAQQYAQTILEVEVHLSQVEAIDSALLNASPSQKAQLVSERLAQLDSLDNLLEKRLMLDSTILSDRITGANTVLAANGMLTPVGIPQQNQKTVNGIYLQTIAKGILNLTSTQVSQLQAVVGQCPMSGGPAVSGARTLLRLEFDSLVYDDATLCQQVRERSAKVEPVESEAAQLTVYPNPTTGEIRLGFDATLEDDTKVDIFDAKGELVSSINILAGQKMYQINTNVPSPGIYTLKTTLENRVVVKRITVLK